MWRAGPRVGRKGEREGRDAAEAEENRGEAGAEERRDLGW